MNRDHHPKYLSADFQPSEKIGDHEWSKILPFAPNSLWVNNLMKCKEHLVRISAQLFSFADSGKSSFEFATRLDAWNSDHYCSYSCHHR